MVVRGQLVSKKSGWSWKETHRVRPKEACLPTCAHASGLFTSRLCSQSSPNRINSREWQQRTGYLGGPKSHYWGCNIRIVKRWAAHKGSKGAALENWKIRHPKRKGSLERDGNQLRDTESPEREDQDTPKAKLDCLEWNHYCSYFC